MGGDYHRGVGTTLLPACHNNRFVAFSTVVIYPSSFCIFDHVDNAEIEDITAANSEIKKPSLGIVEKRALHSRQHGMNVFVFFFFF